MHQTLFVGGIESSRDLDAASLMPPEAFEVERGRRDLGHLLNGQVVLPLAGAAWVVNGLLWLWSRPSSVGRRPPPAPVFKWRGSARWCP